MDKEGKENRNWCFINIKTFFSFVSFNRISVRRDISIWYSKIAHYHSNIISNICTD